MRNYHDSIIEDSSDNRIALVSRHSDYKHVVRAPHSGRLSNIGAGAVETPMSNSQRTALLSSGISFLRHLPPHWRQVAHCRGHPTGLVKRMALFIGFRRISLVSPALLTPPRFALLRRGSRVTLLHDRVRNDR